MIAYHLDRYFRLPTCSLMMAKKQDPSKHSYTVSVVGLSGTESIKGMRVNLPEINVLTQPLAD